MKRLNNVWSMIIDKDNLRLALQKAAKGKKQRPSVRKILNNTELYIDKLYNSLKAGTYKTSKYSIITLFVPKERKIFRLPFYPDRIVHHAIMNIMESFWDSQFIYHSYACRQGKGQHKGSTKCMDYARKYKYVLKCDISKFFPSVDHAILKVILRRKIKDKRLLSLFDEVIDSVNGNPYTPDGKNIPIGNLLSQWFGNLYLNELDVFVKHTLRVHPYIRYSDDFILFSNDKAELHNCLIEIRNFLDTKLKLKLSKGSVFPVSRGIDFLGYRHFPDYVLLRKRTVKKWKRFFKKLELPPTRRNVAQLASFNGIVCHANTYNFRQDIVRNESVLRDSK